MQYSISDLEKLSGVQAHTIRIWEQRYHALKPRRSPGNTRYYEDNDLKRLLNIVSLTESGLRISQICELSDEEMSGYIQKSIEETNSHNSRFEAMISQLLCHGLAYNEPAVNQMLSRCIDNFGVDVAYKEVIYPLLVRLGLFWQKDSICPAQEHFLSNLIRQKLFAAINSIPVPEHPHATWLLFLPEDEGHDISLLYANYILRNAGEKVIYLGSHVPVSSLIETVEDVEIDYFLFFMIHGRSVAEGQKYLDDLATIFPEIPMHIGGSHKLIASLTMPEKMNWLKDIESLSHFIHHLELTP